ncbi:Rho GTPase-activating protein 5 [Capsicum baccatum]|uniref:Rho GTPase-activating protein 5 n=1 Tax=Capsicum baccatum TaxID=33114 RepID=A0A2G2WVA9_CAPBA|nr:Rho GTPase-activating protein 5 [Capsicum baccatum]
MTKMLLSVCSLIQAWLGELPREVLDSLSPNQVLQCQSVEDYSTLVRHSPTNGGCSAGLGYQSSWMSCDSSPIKFRTAVSTVGMVKCKAKV